MVFRFANHKMKSKADTNKTDCGMLQFTDEKIRHKLKTELKQNVDHIAFLPFNDLKESVLDDIQALKQNPLVLDVPITGYIYEVETGKIVKVDA